MANTTTIASKVELHSDTKIFSEITPEVFQAILDVVPAICAVLKWEPLATAFLIEILRQIPLDGEKLELRHVEFGRLLWGNDLTEVAAYKRVSRAISAVKRCQLLSGFPAVWIQSGDKIDGEYYPTTYQNEEFFAVFLEIKRLAKEQDLMSLSPRQRKITQFAIAQSICDARKYETVPKRPRKEKPEKSEKEKSARIEELRRQPNEDFNVDLDWFADQFEQRLCELGFGKEFIYTVKRAHNALDMAEQAAHDRLIIAKTNGGLRLMGGQPK